MRTISYKCDRCGKAMIPRAATKLNMTIQKGNNPMEKTSFDFCSPCFLYIKNAFTKAIIPDSTVVVSEELPDEQKESTVQQKNNMADVSTVESTDSNPLTTLDEDKLVLGPISSEEREQILRLHIADGLSAEQIAKIMRRLPKGINRAINSAMKSGESWTNFGRRFKKRKLLHLLLWKKQKSLNVRRTRALACLMQGYRRIPIQLHQSWRQ